MEKIELVVSGMHCTGCSSRLERVLNDLEGVKAAVDFEKKTAVVEYDENEISVEEVKEAICDAGFEVEE